MRSVLSVVVGGIVAIGAYWGGAVMALLVMHGLPLGGAGGPPTSTDLAVHLALALATSFSGASLTARLSRASPQIHAGVVGLALAIGALVGFGKPASQWPPWFGAAMAAMCLVGAGVAVVRATRSG